MPADEFIQSATPIYAYFSKIQLGRERGAGFHAELNSIFNRTAVAGIMTQMVAISQTTCTSVLTKVSPMTVSTKCMGSFWRCIIQDQGWPLKIAMQKELTKDIMGFCESNILLVTLKNVFRSHQNFRNFKNFFGWTNPSTINPKFFKIMQYIFKPPTWLWCH